MSGAVEHLKEMHPEQSDSLAGPIHGRLCRIDVAAEIDSNGETKTSSPAMSIHE